MMETVFANASVILANQVLTAGTVVVGDDGDIREIASDSIAPSGAIDCDGDCLIPGLVELHTDNLEQHATPRPKANWPPVAAALAHDSQLAISGITTAFDAIALGEVRETGERVEKLETMIAGITEAREKNLLRADHLLHFRCEISYPNLRDIFDPLVTHPLLRLVSIMDHTPGQRQFVNEPEYRIYYQGKYGLSDDEMAAFTDARRRHSAAYGAMHRRHVVAVCQEIGLSLASHDDATIGHVEAAVADGMSIAEFPTTVKAAKASHAAGLKVMMGGPNLVRGISHSGNVSARNLADLGILDIVSSDYIPSSSLHAAFKLNDELTGFSLPRAVRAISKTPAEAVGLFDRGEIAVGKRGDLVRVRRAPGHPLVRGVWCMGHRVA